MRLQGKHTERERGEERGGKRWEEGERESRGQYLKVPFGTAGQRRSVSTIQRDMYFRRWRSAYCRGRSPISSNSSST